MFEAQLVLLSKTDWEKRDQQGKLRPREKRETIFA
jgi:hypothetical protein